MRPRDVAQRTAYGAPSSAAQCVPPRNEGARSPSILKHPTVSSGRSSPFHARSAAHRKGKADKSGAERSQRVQLGKGQGAVNDSHLIASRVLDEESTNTIENEVHRNRCTRIIGQSLLRPHDYCEDQKSVQGQIQLRWVNGGRSGCIRAQVPCV